jgi:hypothetical protein
MRGSSRTVRTVAALAAVLLGAGCEAGDLAPEGVRPGRRLPWPEVAEPVRDWSFAAPEEEIAIEVAVPGGRHSVTVWCVVVDGRIYVATDASDRPKRWVRALDRDPDARLGIRRRSYAVRARRVVDGADWDRVMAAYATKYAAQIGRYDFPKPGDTSRGRIYRLESRVPPPQ